MDKQLSLTTSARIEKTIPHLLIESHRGVKEHQMNLTDYKTGDQGTIVRIEGDPELRLRIMEMGFVRGTQVEVVKYAPLSDPIEFLVKGYHLTLRKEQAAFIVMSEPGSNH
jgi:ferrous iron transport protein A